MQPHAGSYHSGFSYTPYTRPSFSPLPTHATQFHAPAPAHISYNRPAMPQPLNHYAPEATLKTINDNRIVDMHTALKPGMVVEVTRPGHQTELEYVNYSNHLTPLNESVLNHNVPNEIKQEVNRLGGPSYFAHELHNRMRTDGFMHQFNASNFHGPNRPLI